jgi:hypothetical protein
MALPGVGRCGIPQTQTLSAVRCRDPLFSEPGVLSAVLCALSSVTPAPTHSAEPQSAPASALASVEIKTALRAPAAPPNWLLPAAASLPSSSTLPPTFLAPTGTWSGSDIPAHSDRLSGPDTAIHAPAIRSQRRSPIPSAAPRGSPLLLRAEWGAPLPIA